MFYVDSNDLEKIYLTERFHHHWHSKLSPEHNGNMIRPATITNNHISLECKCGHTSLIPVTVFIEKFGREVKLNVVVQKARCSRCRIKNNVESRIVFVEGRVRQYVELPQSNHIRNIHEKKIKPLPL